MPMSFEGQKYPHNFHTMLMYIIYNSDIGQPLDLKVRILLSR